MTTSEVSDQNKKCMTGAEINCNIDKIEIKKD